MAAEHAFYSDVTLETVDKAVFDWFDRSVDAHVQHPNGERKKVVVMFASGERWATSREKRGMRDTNGVLILPIITLRRSGIDPSPVMSALGTETAKFQISKRISPKTNDLMNLNTSRVPSKRLARPVIYEVTTIPFPDRSILTYELQVQAQYIVQMNSILEKIFHELDIGKSFVAPFENDGKHPQLGEDFEKRTPIDRGYVVGFMDSNGSDTGNFEEFTDQERIVRYSSQIRVPTVLQLDPEGEQPSVQVERTTFLLNFGEEKICLVDDPEEIEKIFGPDR